MSFQDLNISYQYRTGDESANIINDFYIPVLSKTKIYRRAVGYFSSNSLVLAAKGVSELIQNNGEMKLIASPQLDKEDLEAIDKGYELRTAIIEKRIVDSLKKPLNILMKERLNYLAWLIANNKLDIKFAVLKQGKGLGIYHEKLGLMEDWNGNIIAFSGSSNETEGGLYNNFESIDVFCSWKLGDDYRVNRKLMDFEKLWNNETNDLDVLDFSQAAKEIFINLYKTETYRKIDPEIEINKFNTVIYDKDENYPLIPQYLKVRDYQKEAIINWFKNECQGLLEMATGTGKTITALTAVAKLAQVTKRIAVVIVCPYIHLVDQWVKDIKEFNMDPIVAYGSRSSWENDLSSYITAYNSSITKHVCVIMTNATFTSETMQDLLRKLKGEVVFVADEAHHLGADQIRKCLVDSFSYRLALSATPNRWFDEEGTDSLLKYFGGKVVFEFGLEKAIGKFLTEYYYYPHMVCLDEDESEKYYEITRKLVRFIPADGKIKKNESSSLQGLLIERARVLGMARNKLIKLKELMEPRKNSKHNIVYCGDSNVDGEKQLDAVIKLLGHDLDMKVHSFTSREDKVQRRELLKRFEDGDLQALIAIKCLDEGVDVPATETAYILASSTNPREFIQRRGRVLRKHPKKKYSYIHDFIVIPRNLDEVRLIEPSLFNIERNLMKRELKRFSEFADLAINGPLAHESLDEVKKTYNLLDI